MQKLNQKGFIGVVEILALVLLVSVIGFTVWRVASIRSEVDQSLSNTDDSSQSSTLNLIKANEEDEAKEVTIPKEEVPKETVAVAEEEVKPKPTPTEDKKKEITYIKFTSRSAIQDGDSVKANGVLVSTQSGTCHFKFKKDGQEKVYATASLSGSKNCAKNIPVSDFPVGGEWQFYIWFVSSDNKTQAYGDIQAVSITL